MTAMIPSPRDAEPKDTAFVGLHSELCFDPGWLKRDGRGYGRLGAKELNRVEFAHRLVVLLLTAELAAGDMVLHRCGNARCINPHHLYVGGDDENRADKLLHQRAVDRWGPFGLTRPTGRSEVAMPQPLALSETACRRATAFRGFSPCACKHVDWLLPTYDGYRQLRETDLSGEVVGAHRKVYALFRGPLDRYDILSHVCADRACLNPYHLFVSGRHPCPRDFDVKHDKRFKLSTDDLARMSSSRSSAAQLAKELGVHRQTVVSWRADMKRNDRPR